MIAPQGCFADICTGLNTYWKFDEASTGLCGTATSGTILDSSGNANTGNCTAQAGTNYVAGEIGVGAISNGGGSAWIIANNTPTISGSFTVSAWINVVDNNDREVIDTRTPSDNSFDLQIEAGSTVHSDVGTGSSWINTSANATCNYTAGTWFHVAEVVTPTGFTIYCNGSSVGSGTWASNTPLLMDGTHKLNVGGPSPYMDGDLDDVRIYSRALSSSDITDLYNYTSGSCSVTDSTTLNGTTTIQDGATIN